MARLFISQQQLDQWIEEERVTLQEDRITMDDGRRYQIAAAVFFQQLVGAEADPHDVLDKVKTKVQLAQLSADHYGDSVLIGEVAYQVLEGFVGEPA